MLKEENEVLLNELEVLKLEDVYIKYSSLIEAIDWRSDFELTNENFYSMYNGEVKQIYKKNLLTDDVSQLFYSDSNISTFKVSNDDMYVAITYYEGEIFHHGSRFKIVDNYGETIVEYTLNEILNTDETIDWLYLRIDAFSSDNQLLWGIIAGDLAVEGWFSVDLETLEIIIYEDLNDWHEDQRLHPEAP